MSRVTRLGFYGTLAVIAAVALAARVLYVLIAVRHGHLGLDSGSYRDLALNLRDGHGYAGIASSGALEPRATFPPGFPAYLAMASLVVGRTVLGLRMAAAALGVVSVVLIGVLGRRLAGPRTGLIAAGLAAVYVPLITTDGSLMSEPLYLVLVLVSVVGCVWLHDGPVVVRALLVGLAIGLAALTRTEGLMLVPFVAGPAVVLSRVGSLTMARRVALISLVAVAAVAVLVPWHIRNARTFARPVWFSGNSASVVAGTACDRHFEGSETGWWTFDCLALGAIAAGLGRVRRLRRIATPGVRLHERSPLGAAAGRAHPRTAGLGVLGTTAAGEPDVRSGGEPRGGMAARGVGLLSGGVRARRHRVRRRRTARHPRWPLVGLVLMVVTSVALTYGNQRFRVAAEPALLVFAAVALTSFRPIERLLGGGAAPELAESVADAPPRDPRQLLEDDRA